MDAFGIFQGGGAKGIAHVGALKALEDRGVSLPMVAGTSAGAIIAALVAAGYRADELFNPDAMGASGVLDIDPFERIDADAYAQGMALWSDARAVFDRRREHSLPGWAVLRRAGRRIAGGPLGLCWRGVTVWRRHRPVIQRLTTRMGLLDTARIEEWLEALLRSKTGVEGRPVVFDDLRAKLRVVVADVLTGEPRVFGGAGQGSVPVAPTVTASACYPIAFTPVNFAGGLLVDGGLISNLPAWAFDEEREEEASFMPSIALRLVDEALVAPGMPETPSTFPAFVWRLAQAPFAGARLLESRRIDDFYAIDLTAAIGTLSFGEYRQRAPDLVRAGRQCVLAYFRHRVGPQDPARMSNVLRLLVDVLARGFGWVGERVRAFVLLPEPGERLARVAYSANMDKDGDDRQRVRIAALGLGAAFRLREPVYFCRARLAAGHPAVDKYEVRAAPSDVGFAYAVPIFKDGEAWREVNPAARPAPVAALVIDKQHEMDALLQDEGAQDLFAGLAALVGEELRASGTGHGRYVGGMAEGALNDVSGWDWLDGARGVGVSRRKERDVGDQPLIRELGRTYTRLRA